MHEIMALKEARKILGKVESDKLTDEQLEKLICDLDIIAGMTIKALLNGEMKIPVKE